MLYAAVILFALLVVWDRYGVLTDDYTHLETK